ncbi:MAG: hypothetical protein OQK09_09075 [Colwellia sp.]|nr:hypothetical protein [Colwellia sp.]MCW9081650.1 hypothetical protein [Colwellia sp.]
MPPLKLLLQSVSLLLTLSMLITSQFSTATEYEVMPIVGYTFSPKLNGGDNTTTLATTDEPNVGLAIAWQDSPTGQGQVLINYITRDFTDNISQSTHSFDTLYAHFSGVALFKERSYTTTFGIGIGATYFDSDFDNVVYPSLTASLGTRYEFSDNLALITELRAYATLTKDDETLFCENDNCLAHFDGAVWFDSQISIGLAYRF